MTPQNAHHRLMQALKAWRETTRAKEAKSTDRKDWHVTSSGETCLEEHDLREAIDTYVTDVAVSDDGQGKLF